eukprot:Gregarina_sp_Poly_1__7880@NODE_447_length_8324_cov_110_573453_g365_i0_p7_GENE_NODE_447_length_8324_cov_110_573453_g365_i0NODE_447_length_8324_cov_110_573453_g365_i0_p7_ORF_typecomplete_len134_score15_35Dmrt1/PF12374_8/0_029_NODE_447_length_8324_cov_110_573453_g365_i018742275
MISENWNPRGKNGKHPPMQFLYLIQACVVHLSLSSCLQLDLQYRCSACLFSANTDESPPPQTIKQASTQKQKQASTIRPSASLKSRVFQNLISQLTQFDQRPRTHHFIMQRLFRFYHNCPQILFRVFPQPRII